MTQPRNTGTLTPKPKGAQSLTWDEATFTWNSAVGTWDIPLATITQTRNTAILTPQPKHA